MTVDIHCDTDLAMAEKFLYDFCMHSHTEKQCCCAMSKIVEAHIGESGFFPSLCGILLPLLRFLCDVSAHHIPQPVH